MGGVRTAVTLLGFHEQELVLRAIEYFDGFRYRRRVDPIFGIHENLAAGFDSDTSLFHFFQNAFVHERLWHVSADRSFVARVTEIAGERLLANDMLSGAHGIDDHGSMQCWRRADVDHFNVCVIE